MIFAYDNVQGRHVREYSDLTIYSIDDLEDSARLAVTPTIDQSRYFVKTLHGTYVALPDVVISGSSSIADEVELLAIKRKYIPEYLI